MFSFDVHSIYRLMRDNHIQFSYKGPITRDVLASLGDAIKEKLHRDDCDAKVVRRIFSILVETAHNIFKYSSEQVLSEETQKSTGIGLIGIGKHAADTFLVFSGNIVSSEEADDIKQRLELINSLSREELKQSYKAQLKSGTVSENGGAGLGLYEVARKSERPIDFSFTDLDNGNKFFEMKVYVKVEDQNG
ncbi:MAG: SiaB family protein kinase [Candidatus Cloacimonetes bacterium]|nr:SiaB family protein kinase [Candidatus Cloacimonadota bacterium]HPF09586.1 SiaB family protein kinase [Candidatus Cloacimonadota bacterium]